MDQMPDWVIWCVMGIAFVIGYGIVSFVLKRVHELQRRPSMMDELFREERSADRKRESTEILPAADADPGSREKRTESGP